MSMAAHGARRLRADGGEPRAHPRDRGAVRGAGHRVPRAAADQPAAAAALARLRAEVPALGEDRYLAPDLEAAARLVRGGALLAASGAAVPGARPHDPGRGGPRRRAGGLGAAAHRHLAAGRGRRRGSTRPAGRSPTPTGTSTPLRRPAARRHHGARDVPSLRDRRQPRPPTTRASIRGRTPPASARRPTSTAGRSGARARSPTPAEVAGRLAAYHAPYHAALAAEVARVRARARRGDPLRLPLDPQPDPVPLRRRRCPTSTSAPPTGTSCAPRGRGCVMHVVRGAAGYTWVLNGRFKGGWTTRHYGRPAEGVHAVQMELAQSTYMDEAPPWTWRRGRAERAAPVPRRHPRNPGRRRRRPRETP